MNAILPAIQQTTSDEIDLAELVHSLWEQKLLIALVTLQDMLSWVLEFPTQKLMDY